jgi:hypothetical protein
MNFDLPALPDRMIDADVRIDAHLAQVVDDLLSLASLGAVHGRPELALGANAALDELVAFLASGADGADAPSFPEFSGVGSHAQH